MKAQELNRILKSKDLGDDFFERNELFDPDFTPVKKEDAKQALKYMNQCMSWYWEDQQKHYLLADCNKFHFMSSARFVEYLVHKKGYRNPAVGLPYGNWERAGMHMWMYYIDENMDLVHVNWGHVEVNPNYDGKGSITL